MTSAPPRSPFAAARALTRTAALALALAGAVGACGAPARSAAPSSPAPTAAAPTGGGATAAPSAAAAAGIPAGAERAHGEHHGHEPEGGAPLAIPAGALYTAADVRFMQGMIAHHAQAIHMSRMAAGRGASPRLVRFAQKIDLSQAGEIVQMQEWLRANGQVAPDTSAWRTTTMHGMLTAEELARLEGARGTAFDRLFLEYMIRHHEGALRMVADLLATPRAAQDVDVSVLANDVETTQSAEIALMRQMLAEL